MAEPERLNNIWYQSFHQMEMAPKLGRRHARELRHLYRALPESLVRIARTRSTTCLKTSPTIS